MHGARYRLQPTYVQLVNYINHNATKITQYSLK